MSNKIASSTSFDACKGEALTRLVLSSSAICQSSKSQPFMTNMRRPLWLLLPLLAMFLAPTEAWEASVSKNLSITITPATQSVSFNPTGLTFASQNVGTSSPPQTVTMTNTGTVSFPLSSIAITGTNSADFAETNNCPSSLAVSANCQISVTFTPEAAGARTASLVASATGGGSYTVSLSGTGVAPTVSAFYVATNGSDSNPGTLAAPFATLGKCQTAMQNSSTIKTCYIRGGTYTGLPSTLPYGSGSWTTALYLTSADNEETWSYYPSDGYNTAILDGGSMVANAGVIGSSGGIGQTCTGGIYDGIWIDGGNNITINGLQFRNFQRNGVAVHGGSSFEDVFPLSVGVANSNLIENNILYNMCGGQQTNGNSAAVIVAGQAQNNTVTHNVAYNQTGMGIRANSDPDGTTASDNISGTTFDHNFVYAINLTGWDSGALYIVDNTHGSTNMAISYNYVGNFGIESFTLGVPGALAHGFYTDNGAANITINGNVVSGLGSSCMFHNTGSADTDTGNICDVQSGSYDQIDAFNSGGGTFTVQHNIIVANAPSCGGQCTYGGVSGATVVINSNGYFNYNSAGTSILTSNASANGDSSPNAITSAPINTCPGGNVNSWGYVVNAANIPSAVSFPAQPAGWATPGFWGPPGYVIPHTGTAPSYGPTC